MRFDWRKEGFMAPPVPRVTCGSEKLYRAWGGDPKRKRGNTERPGVCFSLDRANTRWIAEHLYSVMEYHNLVRYISEFSIPKNIPIWEGKVDPGDLRAVLGGGSGSQVYIERAYIKNVKEVATELLQDDLGATVVYSGRMPKVAS
jgi:hypothetical protein